MMRRLLSYIGIGLIGIAAIFFSLPSVVVWEQASPRESVATVAQPFPVTVDPKNEVITESPEVNAQLASGPAFLMAASGVVGDLLASIATAISSTPWYESLAAVVPVTSERVVTIDPGYRREQVVRSFGDALGWSDKERQTFLASSTELSEGKFLPGAYVVAPHTTPTQAQALLTERLQERILAHYPASVAAVVPLDEALTIASMIERETSDRADMRIISGIIWNRLFSNMKLQIDATVQYAKVEVKGGSNGWWPAVHPRDLSLKSPYNTYVNAGLPPGPIASPSVAAVLAALNPKQTTCLFYFHDTTKTLHCSDTYEQHVALLKHYFGQGK